MKVMYNACKVSNIMKWKGSWTEKEMWERKGLSSNLFYQQWTLATFPELTRDVGTSEDAEETPE